MLKRLLSVLIKDPISAVLKFEDRPYLLGETIKIQVELSSRKESDLSSARIDLECEERWVDTYIKIEPLGRTGGMLGKGREIPGTVPKREVQEYSNTFVHSTFEFSQDTRLVPGNSVRYETSLLVENERPPHAGGGILEWHLVITGESEVPMILSRTPIQISLP